MIAIDSTIVTSPSWIAGMNPAGLMARYSASFSTPASRSTVVSRYGSPIVSSSQTTRNPLPSPNTVIMLAILSLRDYPFKDDRVRLEPTWAGAYLYGGGVVPTV